MEKNQINESNDIKIKEFLEQRREQLLKEHDELHKKALHEKEVRLLRQEFTKKTIKPMKEEIGNIRSQICIAHQNGHPEYKGLLEKYESILNLEMNKLLENFYTNPKIYKNVEVDWWNLVSEFAIESLYDRWLSIRRDHRAEMQVPKLLAKRKELADILSASLLKPIPKKT